MKKQLLMWVGSLCLAGMTLPALAETPLTPKAQWAADSKKALARYNDDKKLCNDESTSNARLQCRRDAKTEYDKAIAAAKAQMTASAKAAPVKAAKVVNGTAPVCADCGKVVAVTMTEKEGESSPVGLIAGGVAGAVLGHQVGSGTGKDLATIAGAVGGAYAGKKIEEKVKTHKVWAVSVHYANGTKNTFNFDQEPGLKVGDSVKNSGNSVVRN
jgi:outer membrane lipoprotein SlyB